MAISTTDFWKLACQGRLFTPEDCQRLGAGFAGQAGSQTDGAALAEWLIQRKELSRYQAKVLLAGRAGPFLFGEYKMLDRVESGPLKGLFRAVHLPTKQPVALHFLSGADTDPAALSRLAQRVAAAAKLRHVHIWTCHTLVDQGAYKFVVVADAVGQSLEALLSGQKALPPVEGCRIGRQIAQGLAHLHAAGLTHGDLRPANVWLDAAGNVKVLHVPFVNEPIPPSKLPADRLTLAADYLAPELTKENKAADSSADVYALGCLLYQMLSGRVPFAGGEPRQKQQRHAAEQPAPLDKVNTNVPRTLAAIVETMLAKDAKARWPNAAKVVEALSPYVPAAKARLPEESATAESRAFDAWMKQSRPAAPGAASTAAVAVAAIASGPNSVPPAHPAAPTAQPAIAVAQPALVQPVRPVGQPAVAVAAVPTPIGQPVAMAQPAAVAAYPAMAQPGYAPPAFVQPVAPAFGVPDVAVPTIGVAAERRAMRKRQGSSMGILAALGLILILGGIGGYLLWPTLAGDGNQPAKGATKQPGTATAAVSPGKSPGEKKPAKINLSNDPPADPNAEKLLAVDEPVWQSPTKGQPLDLKYLPPGTQVYIALRPAEILKHPEGPKVIEGLGPLGNLAFEALKTVPGLVVENVEQVVFGLGEGGPHSPPAVSMQIRTVGAFDETELQGSIGEPAKVAGHSVYPHENGSYIVPGDGQGKLLVFVPINAPDALKEYVAAVKKAPIRLKEVEVLLRTSDADRHLSVLLSPAFLLDDAAESVFAGPAAKLKDPFDGFLVDSAGKLPKACLFSAHLTENDLFVELRVHGTPDDEPLVLAQGYRDRVRDFKRGFKDYLATFNPHDYGKKVLTYFPDMLEQVGVYTVAAADEKQAVVRCYLPVVAAHNLALASQLAVLESGEASVATTAVAAAPAGPKTLAEKLKLKISLGFPRNTLEKCMEMFGEEIGAKVVILGSDLQLEGITKNQSFGLDEKDKPAFEILKSVMLKANPADKLIYVIKKEGDEEILQITTRAAAEKRGDTVPDELKK
jgi:eukaryotic-like serine/threonine-protein kinase